MAVVNNKKRTFQLFNGLRGDIKYKPYHCNVPGCQNDAQMVSSGDKNAACCPKHLHESNGVFKEHELEIFIIKFNKLRSEYV